jgi:hypothetical protein
MLKQIARSFLSRPVTIDGPGAGDAALRELAGRVDALARNRLGRSLSIREIDAGSCNGCELEIHALNNPIYDLERFGIRFVASPRHADVLLVTGPVSLNMREALLRTVAATPEPRWVIAAGDCAYGRPVRRLLRLRRRAGDGGAGRPAYSRLPADAVAAAGRPACIAGGIGRQDRARQIVARAIAASCRSSIPCVSTAGRHWSPARRAAWAGKWPGASPRPVHMSC